MLQGRRQIDIKEQLGSLTEVNIKIRLPKALIDYINEVEVEQHRCVKDLDQYCSEEVMRVMASHLDNAEDTVLKNYTIPSGLAGYDDEIMEVYYGW
jgi:hypothetical protein